MHLLEKRHPVEIDLGLSRVGEVAQRADLHHPSRPLITVGGTNGKGSVVAFLTAIYVAAGYRVGTHTSPHLRRYNERIAINGQAVGDAPIVAAFEAIERAQENTSLTYFEVGALAAMHVFRAHAVDVMIFEVGLGGRLDAVNIWDADVAVITTIALDHEAWLGNTREHIAVEKAGIARAGRPVITGDRHPPDALEQSLTQIGARWRCIQRDFDYSQQENGWSFRSGDTRLDDLPRPALEGDWQRDNASVAIEAVLCARSRLPVSRDAMANGLQRAHLPGRFQRGTVGGHPVILDVGHNPAAVQQLVEQLSKVCPAGVSAVFAVLADKAVGPMIEVIAPIVRVWHLADLAHNRAMPAVDIRRVLEASTGVTDATLDGAPHKALARALSAAPAHQPVLVFGSFFTITDVMELLD